MAALLSMHAVLALLLAVSASLAAGAALEALMEEALEALHVREVRLRAPGAPPSSPNNFPYAVAPLPLGVVRTDSTSPGLQIVGGKDAAPGQFPWMVSMQVMIPSQLWLGSQPQHICGGSLVAPGWVLTAAHCVWGVPQSSLRVDVVLGITNLALVSTTEGAQRITVTRMFAHGKYDHYARRGVGPNDIAMLKLARKATLSDTVKLVPLATGQDQSGAATLSGWGSTSQDGSNPKYPNKLQTAEFPIVAYKDCIDFVNKTDPSAVELLADTNLCVGPLDATGLSSCSGDSGGPLVLEINGQTMQVGVVSWGLVNCGSFPFPSVFTRVSAHYSWVSAVQRKFQD